MSTPRPLPIRVLLKGASLLHDMSEKPQTRDQAVFGRVLEASLLASGFGVDVQNTAVASQMMPHAFRTWEKDVKAWAPDVVILTYGYYECVHLMLPRWLERHAHSLKARPGRIRSFYRWKLLRPVWKVLAKIQQRLDRVVGARGFDRSVRKFEREMIYYIDQTRRVGQPLVMFVEFLVPGAIAQSWFPGMAARSELMNAALHRIRDHYDSPDVILVPVPDIVAERMEPDEPANSDGFHYTAALHKHVGEVMADYIREWVAGQQRFAPAAEAVPNGLP